MSAQSLEKLKTRHYAAVLPQIAPDYCARHHTAKMIEAGFVGFKFKGPGLYYNGANTILILPDVKYLECNESGHWDCWNQEWPEDQQFNVHVWYLPHHGNIFNMLVNAPLRQEDGK